MPSERIAFAGDLGFIVGLNAAALDDAAKPLPESVEMQTRGIFGNLDLILASAGLSRANLVTVRIQLVEFNRLYDRMLAQYRQCMAGNASVPYSCSGVSALTRGAQVDMDFIVSRSR